MKSHRYAMDTAWLTVLRDLGVRPENVLRRAELPADLFSRSDSLDVDAYHRLWSAVETETGDPLFALHVGQSIRTEAFSPPLFAALCSPDLRTAAARLSRYKSLICPIRLGVDEDDAGLCLTFAWLNPITPPASLAWMETVFITSLARTATRTEVRPRSVELTRLPDDLTPYTTFFGTRPRQGDVTRITFSRVDAIRPFLTVNDGMWRVFEPALRRRLAELHQEATTAERVRSVLLEHLPSGRVAMGEVAKQLAMSTRTLQRRLKDEDTTYQQVLQETREELAQHYLGQTQLAHAEIAFLLGFEEPNSFFRAFHDWTGTTPDSYRQAVAAR